MRVLFIGGTGIISSACSELAVERGIELYLLCRGRSPRPIPKGVKVLSGDIRDAQSARAALGSLEFDAVADFISFVPEHIQAGIELFSGRTGQFVFISSASAYKKPVDNWPLTESTPLANPHWQYSRNKIACEELLTRAYRESGFPATIVRPSHTYDKTLLPFDPYQCGYTVLRRLWAGKPVVVHGDGTSLWVLTHHRDFAKGFLGLLANSKAVGEAFHITSDEVLTWNEIYGAVARAAGVTPKLVHVPSAIIAREHPDWGAGLLGDKTHSVIFDNTKVKRFVPGFECTIPFARGAEEIVAFYRTNPDFEPVSAKVDQLMDRLTQQFAV
ncbi:MAG TPA: SDR family oxidoreductase [Polyangiaceae bacterium]|nr:SDR family oxidoreductase [Polyangiaceae bacterium]